MYIGVLGVLAFSFLTALLIIVARKKNLSFLHAFIFGVISCAGVLTSIMLIFPENAELLLYDNEQFDYLTIALLVLIPFVVGYEVAKYSDQNQ